MSIPSNSAQQISIINCQLSLELIAQAVFLLERGHTDKTHKQPDTRSAQT